MKAVISDRIYLDASAEQMELLNSVLTYIVPSAVPYQLPKVVKNFKRLNSKVCSIPVGRLDLIPAGYEIIDRRVLKPVEFSPFKYKLRQSQQDVLCAIEDNTIVNAPVSWGKTFTAIAVAAKLKQKTLIVTHTTILRDQWAEEIRKTLGIEPGIISAGKVDLDSIIVVGNVQSVTKKATVLAEEFGTLILDEMHHVGAATFSTIVDASKARYKIGLSGTLERKDKMHVVFSDYFGFNILKPPRENYMPPTVVIVESNIRFPKGRIWASNVTDLELGDIKYQQLVAELADAAALKGHKVLVVGSRVEFLRTCSEMTSKPSCAITGSIKQKERLDLLNAINSDELDIIFGTMSIFSEGISQNSLSCLILATPMNNNSLLTQLIGRVCRLKEGKLNPLVLDINLTGNGVKNQQYSRLAHYIENGYTVKRLKK